MTFSLLPIEDVRPHPDNVRRDLGDLTELTNSIKAQGVLQPIVVVPNPDGIDGEMLLIAGHRRLAASKAAGLGVIPAIVRTDLTTRAAQIEAMLVENLHRSDLTVMEEAFAYEQLELLGVKPAAIAKATGRARATIEARKALTRLPEPARTRVDTGDLTLDDAAFIAKVRSDTLDKVRDAITRDVREVMRLIVREFPRFNGRDGAQEALNHALAAIDALRGES